MNSKMTIKDKEGKIMKIIAHNQKLQEVIDVSLVDSNSGLLQTNQLGRLSLHNINQTSTNHHARMQITQSTCSNCQDLVPILRIQLQEKDQEILRLRDQVAKLQSRCQQLNSP